MIRSPPRWTRTDRRFSSTTLFRSGVDGASVAGEEEAVVVPPRQAPELADAKREERRHTGERGERQGVLHHVVTQAPPAPVGDGEDEQHPGVEDRKSPRLNSSH